MKPLQPCASSAEEEEDKEEDKGEDKEEEDEVLLLVCCTSTYRVINVAWLSSQLSSQPSWGEVVSTHFTCPSPSCTVIAF